MKIQFRPLFILYHVWFLQMTSELEWCRICEELELMSSLVFLIDHELLEGVEIGRDEGADGLVIVVEDFLSSALWAHRAGWPDQAGVRCAVTLVDHTHLRVIIQKKTHTQDLPLGFVLFCHPTYTAEEFSDYLILIHFRWFYGRIEWSVSFLHHCIPLMLFFSAHGSKVLCKTLLQFDSTYTSSNLCQCRSVPV